MLHPDQHHALKYLLTQFRTHQWKFQYEKRHEMEDALENFLEIDSIIKRLERDHPRLVKALHDSDLHLLDDFRRSSCFLARRIINVMRHEDARLEDLKEAFVHHPADVARITRDKLLIESEEFPERGFAEGLQTWAERMLRIAEHYAAHHPLLADMSIRLRKVIKDMKWFEREIDKEHRRIEEAQQSAEL